MNLNEANRSGEDIGYRLTSLARKILIEARAAPSMFGHFLKRTYCRDTRGNILSFLGCGHDLSPLIGN